MGVYNRHGYLLIELMIAIVLISCMGVIIGRIQGHTAIWHQQAAAYLNAASLASTVIGGGKMIPNDSITVRKTVSYPFTGLPYAAIKVEITVPFHGAKKTFAFVGGRAEYDVKK